MMKEAARATREESLRLRVPKPLIFGVTILTSLSSTEIKEIGFERNIILQVKRLAHLAKAAGLDGVVASGNEIGAVKSACGTNFKIVVPGIRPADTLGKDDQKRMMTPGKAQKLGADPDFKLVPPPYSYWLGKRAKSAFEGKPSTWTTGLGERREAKS